MSDQPSAKHAGEGVSTGLRELLCGREFSSVPLSRTCDCLECCSPMSTAAGFEGLVERDVGGPICMDCAALLVASEVGGGE